AVSMGQRRLYSDLPDIMPGNVVQDSLQIQQGVLAWFGTREAGGDGLVQGAQGQGPAADLLEEASHLHLGGRLRKSHAFLLADGTNSREFYLALECHIHVRNARDLG